jgi:SNF2 family DNA or RNA helicase
MTPCPARSSARLVEQLGDVLGGGHRALVFSQFTGFLGKVRDRLEHEGIGYCYLDGRTRHAIACSSASRTARTRCS